MFTSLFARSADVSLSVLSLLFLSIQLQPERRTCAEAPPSWFSLRLVLSRLMS